MEDLVTVVEAAQIMGIPVRTLHNWITTERIRPAMKLPGLRGAFLFRRRDIVKFARTLAETA